MCNFIAFSNDALNVMDKDSLSLTESWKKLSDSLGFHILNSVKKHLQKICIQDYFVFGINTGRN